MFSYFQRRALLTEKLASIAHYPMSKNFDNDKPIQKLAEDNNNY